MTPDRRIFLQRAATSVAAASPLFHAAGALAQASPAQRRFNPQPGPWRTFDVTTRVDIVKPQGLTQVWLPVPTVESDWQVSLTSDFIAASSSKRT